MKITNDSLPRVTAWFCTRVNCNYAYDTVIWSLEGLLRDNPDWTINDVLVTCNQAFDDYKRLPGAITSNNVNWDEP